MTPRVIALLSLAMMGCASLPPAPAIQRTPLSVSTPFGRAWEAAVDVFADKNIGIRTIDRSSGLIVADPVHVPPASSGGSKPSPLADCGVVFGSVYPSPASAIYNVRVRGDSTLSTVFVTVRWTTQPSTASTQPVDCSSKGIWEADFERAVKEKAETKRQK